MATSDDDAFTWEGDDDPTLTPTGSARERAARPAPPGAALDETGAHEPLDAEAEPAAGGIGNVALVAYGVLGGVYALWTLGWILGSSRLREWIELATGGVADVIFQGSMYLAMLAPLLWFVAALVATRSRPAWIRFAALVAGVVVLVPWPFVMVGVIGQ
ncbi:DNA polymerase III subunit gamma/tau [Microbacterium excoecariae]|uniref:DNA polymerase III subunit gamma/tau n=1 Tax=Microbacterium excoecariae TaxID=2715210 RepID=UPI0014086D39|nr:DNA polymerase III subunit gamma/tau [Microbacterium excoecariae]